MEIINNSTTQDRLRDIFSDHHNQNKQLFRDFSCKGRELYLQNKSLHNNTFEMLKLSGGPISERGGRFIVNRVVFDAQGNYRKPQGKTGNLYYIDYRGFSKLVNINRNLIAGIRF